MRILTAVPVKFATFWNTTPCSVVEEHQHFRGTHSSVFRISYTASNLQYVSLFVALVPSFLLSPTLSFNFSFRRSLCFICSFLTVFLSSHIFPYFFRYFLCYCSPFSFAAVFISVISIYLSVYLFSLSLLVIHSILLSLRMRKDDVCDKYVPQKENLYLRLLNIYLRRSSSMAKLIEETKY
jgi:hypothetical protein